MIGDFVYAPSTSACSTLLPYAAAQGRRTLHVSLRTTGDHLSPCSDMSWRNPRATHRAFLRWGFCLYTNLVEMTRARSTSLSDTHSKQPSSQRRCHSASSDDFHPSQCAVPGSATHYSRSERKTQNGRTGASYFLDLLTFWQTVHSFRNSFTCSLEGS